MLEENKNLKSESALREERVLEFWKENKIFEKSLDKKSPKGEFVFYEGPPTANGKPGIHHLEARAFKDAIPRYKTMQGFHVRRKAGWDTHGLPVEIQVEKKLGLNSKKAIEEYGLEKFNQECKQSVWEYADLWKKFTNRTGYWVDLDDPYVTYYNEYIESVWNVVKKIDDQKLLYKDYKVLPWCPRCGTALSSHELAQGYQDVKDLSLYVKFKVVGPENTFVLAWTTTPWTLPSNLALAVGENIDYVKIKKDNEILILAESRLSIAEGSYEVVEKIKGKDLVGLEYEPLFPFQKDNGKAFKVYPADFVTTEDGTGIVHTAVMYGQDDFALGNKVGLPKAHLVSPEGLFMKDTGWLEGRSVVDETLAVDILKDLQTRGLLFGKEKYEHSYPFCWRCKTRLIYYARDSWYIRMSDPKIKEKLISENKKINWEPAHMRDGRFGEWLKEIKDWAVSRERYWGTPLPVWQSEDGERLVVDSIETLKKYTKKSGNKYFVARHGGAMSNLNNIINSKIDENNKLTPEGIQYVENSARKFKDTNFDFIFCSPMPRTKQTAGIIADASGFDKSKIVFDDRLIELQMGDLEGRDVKEYLTESASMADYFTSPFKGGESRQSVYKRLGDFIYELENKYKDKKILIVSHGDPIMALFLVATGYSKEQIKIEQNKFKYFQTGEIRVLDFVPLPHNENHELDLHRPFIDSVVLGKDGKEFKRVKEVMDVWFDSGSMPYAQDHYPFEKESRELLDGGFFRKAKGYPADFIAEAIDQTRGWFYTLHAVGVLMGRGLAYKNVISLGHLLDEKGKKMSKSLGNIVDPWEMSDKYGVDTLRLWMYSVNQPGESKNFDEKTVLELQRQVFGLLYNVLAFYELYRNKSFETRLYDCEMSNEMKSGWILDSWINSRLNELSHLMTEKLDSYKLLEPTRAIKDFINDLSTWYLRRSRERIKNQDKAALHELYHVLRTVTLLLAPLAPFAAEDIYQKLRLPEDPESVHLEEWPKFPSMKNSGGEEIIRDMEKTREVVSLGLKERQKAGLAVRQPLLKLEVPENLRDECLEIIKDELNVKEVVVGKELKLHTEITPELKQEGDFREFLRGLQDMRKNMGLTPSEAIKLTIQTTQGGQNLIKKFDSELKKVSLVSGVVFGENNGEDITIDSLSFKVKIDKI